MLNINLINFILNNFLNTKLACLLLFHCWQPETLYHFSKLSSLSVLYSQYINLNDSEALHNFGYRYMRYDQPQIGIFMDLNCNQSDYLVVESSHQRLFNYSYSWLIYDDLSSFSRFYETFKNINLSVDTQLTFAMPKQPQEPVVPNGTSYIAFDVYNNDRFLGGSLNVTRNYEIECHQAGCQKTKYLSELHKRPLYGNRESLRDVTMRVAVVAAHTDLHAPEEKILEYLLTPKDFHIDPISKFSMQIFMLLKDSLYTNVNYTYYNSWSKTETKGGIVGALIEKRADLASSAFFCTIGRLQYLTPIAETGRSRSVCMFRTPRNSGIQGGAFIHPFSTQVWISFGLILAVAALSLWLVFFMEFHQMKLPLQFVPSLLTAGLISFGSACIQGSILIPHSMAGRLAFISLSLSTFVMYNFYTSVVVSSLLGSPVKSKINTLEDLTDSKLDVGLEPLPYTQSYLNFSTLPVVRNFVKRKMKIKKNFESVWYSPVEGINRMRSKPGFVYIFEAQTGYYLIENQYEPHEICDLNEFLFRTDSSLTLQMHKNSSFKEIVRLKIMRLLETGVHSKHRRLWNRSGLNCLSKGYILSVGMEYAAPLFLMLLGCYLMVLIIFLMEILWHRYTKKKMANERDEEDSET